MGPKTILLMRHAEKRDDPSDPDLSDAGVERAERLVKWIPQTFGKPDFIFASAISKHSARPYETVKPLSKADSIPLDATYADQDYGALAQYLFAKHRYDGCSVLICWHHGNIPSLAEHLRAPQGSYPDPWKGHVFNLVLRFDYSANGVNVTQITEPF